MSEENKHKLSKILYYSDIHPADTEFINNIIYDYEQENKQLKERIDIILEDNNQLEEIRIKAIEYIKKYYGLLTLLSTYNIDELLAILGDKE